MCFFKSNGGEKKQRKILITINLTVMPKTRHQTYIIKKDLLIDGDVSHAGDVMVAPLRVQRW